RPSSTVSRRLSSWWTMGRLRNYSPKGNESAMLWEVDVLPRREELDRQAARVKQGGVELGIDGDFSVATARVFLLDGSQLGPKDVSRLENDLLADRVVERSVAAPVGKRHLTDPAEWRQGDGDPKLLHVLPKPGVMEPVALSTQRAIADLGLSPPLVRTC